MHTLLNVMNVQSRQQNKLTKYTITLCVIICGLILNANKILNITMLNWCLVILLSLLAILFNIYAKFLCEMCHAEKYCAFLLIFCSFLYGLHQSYLTNENMQYPNHHVQKHYIFQPISYRLPAFLTVG